MVADFGLPAMHRDADYRAGMLMAPTPAWGQPPPAVRRSKAPLIFALPNKNLVELRSTGQPGAAAPAQARMR
jgi:hypothetical protein